MNERREEFAKLSLSQMNKWWIVHYSFVIITVWLSSTTRAIPENGQAVAPSLTASNIFWVAEYHKVISTPGWITLNSETFGLPFSDIAPWNFVRRSVLGLYIGTKSTRPLIWRSPGPPETDKDFPLDYTKPNQNRFRSFQITRNGRISQLGSPEANLTNT